MIYALTWTAAPAAAAHFLALLAAIVVGGVLSTEVGWGILMLGFISQIVAIVWYASLGSVVGRYANPLAAGITATVVALISFYSFGFGDGFRFLDFGGSTVSRLGLTWRMDYIAAQLLVMGVMIIGFLVLPIRSHERKFEWDLKTSGVVVVLVVLLTGAGLLGPTERTALMDVSEPDVCYFITTTVCFFREHERIAEPTVVLLDQLVEAATDSGYGALIPEEIHEESWSYRSGSSRIMGLAIPSDVLAGVEWDQLDMIQRLLVPSHCPEVFGDDPPDERYFEELQALTFTWISLVEDPQSLQLVDVPQEELEDVLTPEEASMSKSYLDSCEF